MGETQKPVLGLQAMLLLTLLQRPVRALCYIVIMLKSVYFSSCISNIISTLLHANVPRMNPNF